MPVENPTSARELRASKWQWQITLDIAFMHAIDRNWEQTRSTPLVLQTCRDYLDFQRAMRASKEPVIEGSEVTSPLAKFASETSGENRDALVSGAMEIFRDYNSNSEHLAYSIAYFANALVTSGLKKEGRTLAKKLQEEKYLVSKNPILKEMIDDALDVPVAPERPSAYHLMSFHLELTNLYSFARIPIDFKVRD